MNNLNLNVFLLNLLVTFPYIALLFSTSLILCGYKESLTMRTLLKVTVIQTVLDVIFSIVFSKYGLQMIPSLISCIILTIMFFKIDFLSALIITAIANLFSMLSQFVYLNIICNFTGHSFSEFVKVIDMTTTKTPYFALLAQYVYFILHFLLLLFLYKRDIYIINLKKYKVLNNTSSKIFNNLSLIAIIITPITFFIIINFAIDYYNIFNNVAYSFPIYLTINSLVVIFSSILLVVLVKKIISLKYYKAAWEAHQKYLVDINELLKGLRAQKHGFLNHMNVLYGLITLEEYDSAKEYLSGINETISFKNNGVSINNPTLNALLNVKVKIAENKHIKTEVKVDDTLADMNFKIFELEEAIGNIIDNAMEATFELDEKDRYIRIDIYSDDTYFIFDIQNKGKTISPDMIDNIFKEGFSTKNFEHGDHGFGLYISKNIIECHGGLIKVDSKNNYTSFKIYLPKVINREFRAS